MQLKHEGRSLWYATADAPGPEEAIPAGAEVTITVGIQPADMSNRVELLYRINQGQTETVPAKWVQNDSSGKAQYFRARLPAFRAGDVVEYVPVCRCAGRQVPAANDIQAFTSSFRVAEAGADLIRTRATRATSSSARSART